MEKLPKKYYDRLSNLSVRVVGEAHQHAMRAGSAMLDSNDLLYGFTAVGSIRKMPITNELLVAAGLTKTAVETAIAINKNAVVNVRIEWAKDARRVLENAIAFADDCKSAFVEPAHILHGLMIEAKRSLQQGVGQVIHKITPYLNLNQMLKAIEDLLSITDRKDRAESLADQIAVDNRAFKLLDAQRIETRRIEGNGANTLQLLDEIAAAELALKIKRLVRDYLQARS